MDDIAEDGVYEVDALKAIRMFWSPITKKLEPRYLTSWVGYSDADDDWSPVSNFDDPDLVRRFEAIVPKDFDRTKYGSMYEAPKEWIDNELRAYYQENPEKLPSWRHYKKINKKQLAERQERLKNPALGLPEESISARQIRENEAEYNEWRAEQAKAQRLVPISQRKAKQTEEKLKRASKSKMSFSGWEQANKPKAKRATLDTAIDGWLSFFGEGTGALSEYQEPTYPGDRTRPHSSAHSRKTQSNAGPVRRTRSIIVDSPPEGPLGEEDPLFTDTESSEGDIPLAKTATGKPYTSLRGPVGKGRATLSSSSSESDVPLANLRAQAGVTAVRPALKKPTIKKGVKPSLFHPPKPPVPIVTPTTTTPSTNKGFVPLSASAGAWDSVRDKIPWAKDLQSKPQVATKPTPVTAAAPRPVFPTPEEVLPMDTDELFLESPERPQSSMDVDIDVDVDVTAEADNFMGDVYEQLAATDPTFEETSKWAPVSLMLKTDKGNDELCKVLLLNVTSVPEPPSLKWIHRKGFVFKSTHLAAQLDLILLAYKPHQHARLGPESHLEAPALGAFAKYLSDTGVMAIADTEFPETKLCIYPSWPPFCAERFKLAPSSDLHLMITVLKYTPDSPSISSASRLTAAKVTDVVHRSPTYLTPSENRGLRILDFPEPLAQTIQRRRALGALSYTLCTAESISFRFEYSPNPKELKEVHIDNVDPSQHRRRGVLHVDETVALIELMRQWDVTPKKASVGNAAMVFIHNNAWDMLGYLPGLMDRKTKAPIGFYAYGPYHALYPSLWGVREIFKRGGVLTFTAEMILAEPVLFQNTMECVKDSNVWVAFVSPLVVGLLQAEALKDERFAEPLFMVLEAIREGHLFMTTAPPPPWKTDEWTTWLERNLSMTLDGISSSGSEEVIDTLLDAAETALQDFTAGLLNAKKKRYEAEEKEAKSGGFSRLRPAPAAALTIHAGELMRAVDERVFKDLRRVMFVPVMHTEYRQFVVLHDVEREEMEWKRANAHVHGPAPKRKDSIEHVVYRDLVWLDKVTFGRLGDLLPRIDKSGAPRGRERSGTGSGVPPPTPGSAGIRSAYATPMTSPITSR